ncbi:hypothetical protein BD770DRAFT_398027 [Pilaira anomala]|nr:hypothetical protein BD770DRAFT_398027 [Pilaira anomala]
MPVITKKYQYKKSFKKPKLNPTTKKTTVGVSPYDDLVSELDYSYDSLATITVILNSLRLTYTTNKDSIEQFRNNARLNDMEKELLTAYDDLSLQINHLKKDITKIEEKILKLKDEDCILSCVWD